jgi:urease accessory protein
MSVATLRYSAPLSDAALPIANRHQRGNGAIELSFAKAGDATRLAGLYQRSPCRVLFPKPPAGDAPLAVLVNTSGGLAGGDHVSVAVKLEPGTAAAVTTQAAEKIYRSIGPDARVETELAVAEDARLEYLPQETILFDGACLERSVTAAVARGGRLLACETLVFGRAARGETMARGRVRDCWRIEYDGRLAWFDRFGLSGPIAGRLDGAGFGGARALATLLYAGARAEALVAVAREAAERAGGAASLVNGILVARMIGAEPSLVRDGLAHLLGALRFALFGARAAVPSLWAI